MTAFGLPPPPARPPGQQLRPGRTDHQQRHLARPLGQVVDEIKQPIIGPVQILEHQHQRPPLGQGLEELPPRRERLAPAVAADRYTALHAGQRAQVPPHPVRIRAARHHLRGHLGQLGRGLARGVAVQDPCLGLDHLRQRPEADPLPVRKRAALPPADQLRLRLGDPRQLIQQPGLADPRHPHQRDQLRGPLRTDPGQRVAQHAELPFPAHQDRPGLMRHVHPEPGPRLQRLPDRHRVPLALRRHRRRLAVIDHRPRLAEGALADQDPVHRRGGLQPRRRVHHITRGHPLPLGRAGPQQDQRLPGIHRDPDLDLLLLPSPIADRQRGPHRPLRIILMRDRRPEHRHHRIPDELLHRPAEPLQLGPQPRVIRRQQRPDVLRVHLLGPGSKTHQVREQHADDLALLVDGRLSHHQSHTALRAELRPRLVTVAARGTNAHPQSLRPASPPPPGQDTRRSSSQDHAPPGTARPHAE